MKKLIITTHSPVVLSKLALMHAKDIIKDLKVYLLTKDGYSEELPVTKEYGEVTLPDSMVRAYEELSEEALKLMPSK